MSAKILIVDDSAVSAQFFTKALEKENYEIITSCNAKDTIGLINKHDIDVVLLDIIMPEMDGYEILKALQESANTKDIPVIMITQLTAPQEVQKALDFGAMDFIRKTSEPIEVVARIRSAFRLKQKQDQLKRNAITDHLTQLYNKQYFNEVLEGLIREKFGYNEGVALILMDCDHFKKVNDRHGHMIGDMVLATIGNEIAQAVSPSDIACRFGGEEFCVLLMDASQEQAYEVAERLRERIKKTPFSFQGGSFSITVSCGVGHIGRDENKSGLKLVNESDLALYEAKRNGRDQTVIFSRQLTASTNS